MADSSLIDAALVAKLLNDTTLAGLMPDGVFFDEAKQGAQKFVIVSLVDESDEGKFGGRAFEDALYLVKAVALNSSGGDVKTAAARIDALLEDQALTVSGYTWMTTHREARIRYTEVDEIDRSIRWQHRGGRYRVQLSPG
jgi:hypothetical protein